MTLDALWDFNDPEASEARFRERCAVTTGDERLEVLTQVARAQGLRGRFDEAHVTLDDVERSLASAPARVRVRYLLERGRALRSGGRLAEAASFFADALTVAEDARHTALAVDAVHMLAITAGTPEEQMRWHQRGIALASSSTDTEARRWLPTLRNNLGWSLFEAGRLLEALIEFERAADERRSGTDARRTRIADWAVARTLRALGRTEEALAIQRRLLGEWSRAAEPAPYVNEELGECLLALGRSDEARPFFGAAYALLAADAAFAAAEPERLARLARLAART